MFKTYGSCPWNAMVKEHTESNVMTGLLMLNSTG